MLKKPQRISVCEPLLGSKEEQYVLECLRDNWISSNGKFVGQFETAFSAYCGQKYGIGVCNGTVALHLALAALDVGPGDEVIMPTFTIASTAFAAIYCGAKPVFVDVQQDTWNMDPAKIEAKITKKTKVIMPVHMYGHPCDMEAIMRVARKYRLYVVEDAAETHGAQYRGQKVGSFGDIACFSFYSNKIITCGEGGMVVTRNTKLAEKCQRLKNLAFLKERRFLHKEIGFNYRMTNIQAALGLAQFERIEEMIESRRRNAAAYRSLLADVSWLEHPVERSGCLNVYWMYGLLVDKRFGMKRDALMKALQARGVETRTFFIPMHQQPILQKLGHVSKKDKYPIADDIAARGLYLPSGSGLKRAEIAYVCDCLKALARKA